MSFALLENRLDIYNKRCCALIREIEKRKKEEQSISQPIVVGTCAVPYLSGCVEIKNSGGNWASLGKKEENMITATIDSGHDQARNYLRERARSIREETSAILQRQFGLLDDTAPKTANELVARIKDGKYVIKADRGDKETYGDGMQYIRWRDPAKTEDKAGYKTAFDALHKQYMAAKDAIIVMDPKEGLTALQAFESATIH